MPRVSVCHEESARWNSTVVGDAIHTTVEARPKPAHGKTA